MLERIVGWYTKLFVVWVILFCTLAYYCHDQFAPLKQGMDWFFALTMFGIGSVLSLDDFKRIARQPWIVLIGVTAQFTIMPLGAFALAKLFNLPPMLALGLILAGSAPGAMASNVVCYIARADTAYSVSLTAVATLLCPVMTPFLVKLLAQSYLPIPAGDMFLKLVLTVIAPLILGLALNTLCPKQMKRFAQLFPAVSVTFIVFICAVVVAIFYDRWRDLTPMIVVVALLLNLYGMSSGYGLGRLMRFEPARRRTLAIEIGMQNAGLGAVLAINHFGDHPEVAVPPAIFVFVCIFTASLLVERWSRQPAEGARDSDVSSELAFESVTHADPTEAPRDYEA